MATATHIELSPAHAGVLHVPEIKIESAARGSQVLQENHDKNHCFFNADGFHNHILHHILTIFALGASADEIQKAYDENKDLQRPSGIAEERIIQDMHSPKDFQRYLGQEKYYIDYLQFFQQTIEAKGIEKTFQEHIFGDDEVSKNMLGRLYADFLHPIIHTGFGLEFSQPAVVAEGLAETAVSSDWFNVYFDQINDTIASSPSTPSKPLLDILADIRSHPKLVSSPHWDDPNKVRHGILARAPNEMIAVASQWRIPPTSTFEDLEFRTAEMIQFSSYMTGCAVNPKKQIKFDFYYMHCLNASIFYSTLLNLPWLSLPQKAKLLEMKGWLDLAMYVSRKSPKLYPVEITNYQPKIPSGWKALIERVDRYPDDGHASKFLRALMNGEKVCKPYEEKETWPVNGEMWLRLGHMLMDSVEDTGARWARSVGFDEAWVEYEDRSRL